MIINEERIEVENNMKKIKPVSLVVVGLFLVGIIFLISASFCNGGMAGGFQTSSVSFNCTYIDGSMELVNQFDFKYNNVKKETKVIKSELDKVSKIVVTNFTGTSSCHITILDNEKELWSGEIESNAVYENLVQDKGVYELIIEMNTGNGEGSINIL